MSAAELGSLIVGGSWAIHLSLIVLVTAYGVKKGYFDPSCKEVNEKRMQNYLTFNIIANVCILILLLCFSVYAFGSRPDSTRPGSSAFAGPLGVVVVILAISAVICALAIPTWHKPKWLDDF